MVETSGCGVGGFLRSPDLGESWDLIGPLLTPQLTTGRLGQVVEDKKPIQLKDLTSVSHSVAGPGEEEGESPLHSPQGQGLWDQAD